MVLFEIHQRFKDQLSVFFNLSCASFNVSPCLAGSVQPYMEWIQIKKNKLCTV